MAEPRERSGVLARRLLGVVSAIALLGLFAPAAIARSPKEAYADAKAEVARLEKQIAATRRRLDAQSAEAARLWERVQIAEARFELIVSALRETRSALAEAQDEYAELEARLNDRARETFMAGPASNLEFVLGATSFADLSARMEYVDALTRSDADLANQYQNLKNELSAKLRDQERLAKKQAEALQALNKDRAELAARLEEQQRLYDDLRSKMARAERIAKEKLREKEQWERRLAAAAGLGPAASGVFKYCPVDQPRALYDGFGAPRYAGGYHPHAGNDIIAPMGTKIRAPFDGYARSSYNTLGGSAVYVYGAHGYVYNAHLSGYSAKSDGPVKAGDVIGYVGETGDTNTPHDHFEWHPKVTPDPNEWPASPYGYSVIDTGSSPAVNPWPLLQAVC
jgi:murein DD-endopeptidase MepM/ murein hydrolase activator NlpD